MDLTKRYNYNNWYAVLAYTVMILIGGIIAAFISNRWVFVGALGFTALVFFFNIRFLHIDESVAGTDALGRAWTKTGGWFVSFPILWIRKGRTIDRSLLASKRLGPATLETADGIRTQVWVRLHHQVLDPVAAAFGGNLEEFINTVWPKLTEAMTSIAGAFTFEQLYRSQPIELKDESGVAVRNPQTGKPRWQFAEIVSLDPRFVTFAGRIGEYIEVLRDDVTGPPEVIAALESREIAVRQAIARRDAAEIEITLEENRAKATEHIRRAQIMLAEAAAAKIRLAIEAEADGLKRIQEATGVKGDVAYVVQNMVEAFQALPGGTQLILSQGGGGLFDWLLSRIPALQEVWRDSAASDFTPPTGGTS